MKRSSLLAAVAVCIMSIPLQTQAVTLGESSSTSSGSSHTSTSSSSDNDEPKIDLATYTPKVTSLHSINALLAQEQDVYFLPALEDFPTSLKESASLVTSNDGKTHSFAAVYDGEFDSEVAYVSADSFTTKEGQTIPNSSSSATGRILTTKKVYDSTDSSRALTLMGYDLLLRNEYCTITTDGNSVSATYVPDVVGNSELNAQTVVMDIYKAMLQYEWDIQFAWCKDDSIKLQSHPIQQQIQVLTTEKGVNTTEGATWVWASRSNPELYWDRCLKDYIFDNGAHNATTSYSMPGTNTSVSFMKRKTDRVTLGEFCSIARAIMELYGEPTITEREEQLMLENYGVVIPTSNSDEITESIRYLAAKGILDPTDLDFSKYVTFADIEVLLLRICDNDSRLTLKELNHYLPAALQTAGYVNTKVSLDTTGYSGLDELANPNATPYNTYLIATDDAVTNSAYTSGGRTYIKSDQFCIVSNGNFLEENSGFYYDGIDSDGYYVFRIDANASGILNIGHTYEDGSGQLQMKVFNLNAGGGVYEIADNHSSSLQRYTFDDKDYPETYLDIERRKSSILKSAQLSGTLHWYKVTLTSSFAKDSTEFYNELINATYDGKAISEQLNTLLTSSTNDPVTIADDVKVWWYLDSGGNTTTNAKGDQCLNYTFVFQTSDDETSFSRKLSFQGANVTRQDGFYKPDGKSTLVSYNYLNELGLVTSASKINDLDDWVICCNGDYQGNIYLLNSVGKIIVGSIMYDANDEILSYNLDGDLYINYRACLGWTVNTFTLTSKEGVILGTRSPSSLTIASAVIKTDAPDAALTMGTLIDASGQTYLNLSSTYPLSNWIIVPSPYDANTAEESDELFIWHLRKVTVKGEQLDLGDDSVARDNFKAYTGIDVSSISTDYHLSNIHLNRDYPPEGFVYKVTNVGDSGRTRTATVGWLYSPPIESSTDIYASYYNLSDSSCVLPIVYDESGHLWNINKNVWTMQLQEYPLEYGYYPLSIATGIVRDMQKMAIPTRIDSYSAGSELYDTAAAQVTAAPTNLFLMCLPNTVKVSIGNATESSIYYGTSKCTVNTKNNSLVLKVGNITLNNTENEVYKVYNGVLSSVVYSCYPGTTAGNTSAVKDKGSGNILEAVQDAAAQVDWERFKLAHMLNGADNVLSILLIFVLNVLPRFFILWFLSLLLLALIKNVKLWRKFNEDVFDLYSLLTFGRQTYATINVRRVIMQSICYMAMCYIFMDGTLFNFIIWCGKLFIYLGQR